MLFHTYGQAVLTLHERHSRLIIARRLPGKAADPIASAIAEVLAPLPPQLRRTITFDNGTEFARHHRLHDLGIQTFFCDTRSPWQKGGIENANGRLRRTLPRKIDLAALPENQFTRLIQAHNNTPRKCLGYRTPAEIILDHVLHLKCESTFPPRGNDGGWRSARSPSPRRRERWLIPAFAGMTVVGVRRGHPHPAGDGFPPSREPSPHGGWRSARSPSPRRGWIPAFAGMTVVRLIIARPTAARSPSPHRGWIPAFAGMRHRWLAFGAVTLTPPGMDSRLRGNDGGRGWMDGSRLRGNDGGWRSARSPSPRRGWIPAFAGMTVVGVRRGHPHPAGDGFPPSRERRWLAFGAVTLAPPGMDSRLRGNDGGWRSARSPSPRRGWIPAFAGTTVVGVRRGHPHPAGDGFPPSRERRWLAFGAVTLTPPGMDSRLRGNDGGWRSARSPSPRRGWIPAFAGTTVVGVRRGHPHPTVFPPSRE